MRCRARDITLVGGWATPWRANRRNFSRVLRLQSVYELGVARRRPGGRGSCNAVHRSRSVAAGRGGRGLAADGLRGERGAPPRPRGLAAHLKIVFDVLMEAVDAGAVALYAETTAQHFATITGGYFASGVAPTRVPSRTTTACRRRSTTRPATARGGSTPTRSSTRAGATVAWDAFRAAQRNRDCTDAAAAHAPAPRAPLPLWDLHRAAATVRHFCFSPGLVEAILGELVRGRRRGGRRAERRPLM